MDTQPESHPPTEASAEAHCTRVPAAALWREARPEQGQVAAAGSQLSTQVDVMSQGGTYAAAEGLAGEEVFAILEGAFRIDAADETYRLCAGEAILIPPGAARRAECLTSRGAFYRVGTPLSVAIAMDVYTPYGSAADGHSCR